MTILIKDAKNGYIVEQLDPREVYIADSVSNVLNSVEMLLLRKENQEDSK